MNRFNKRVNPTNSFRGRVISFLLSAILLGISALLIVNSVRSVVTAHKRSLLLDQANSEVDELRVRNLSLISRYDEILSDSYIEREARNRLYYVKSDEMMVILPETGETSLKPKESETDTADVEEMKGWMQWWSVLCDGV